MCLILRENNVLGVRCIDMVSGSFTGRWPLRAYWLGPARWGGLSREPAFLCLLAYLYSHDFASLLRDII